MITTRSRTTQLALATVGLTALVAGCASDNGLPGDLTQHLAGQGIVVQVLGSEAPLRSRAGFLYFTPDPSIEARIVTEFNLSEIEPGSQEFENISGRAAANPKALWGASGRPPELRLADGGQFEYLYLLTTLDGQTYLFAEYAYG